jgi:hypothetical protein
MFNIYIYIIENISNKPNYYLPYHFFCSILSHLLDADNVTHVMNTIIYTYIHIYVRTYIRTYIHTYIRTSEPLLPGPSCLEFEIATTN